MKLMRVVLEYYDGPPVSIDARQLEDMLKAAEAIEMLERAKSIAKRLLG